jgi:hypothetical protein
MSWLRGLLHLLGQRRVDIVILLFLPFAQYFLSHRAVVPDQFLTTQIKR